MLLGDRRHGLSKYTVDAELDAHRVIASYDVNITGPPLHCGKNRGINQTNNRAYVTLLRGQPVDRNAFFRAAFIFPNYVESKSFACVLKNPLRLFRLLEDL